MKLNHSFMFVILWLMEINESSPSRSSIVNNCTFTGQFLANPENPFCFYRCDFVGTGKVAVHNFCCQEGTVWDQSLLACVFKPFVGTTKSATTETVVTVSRLQGPSTVSFLSGSVQRETTFPTTNTKLLTHAVQDSENFADLRSNSQGDDISVSHTVAVTASATPSGQSENVSMPSSENIERSVLADVSERSNVAAPVNSFKGSRKDALQNFNFSRIVIKSSKRSVATTRTNFVEDHSIIVESTSAASAQTQYRNVAVGIRQNVRGLGLSKSAVVRGGDDLAPRKYSVKDWGYDRAARRGVRRRLTSGVDDQCNGKVGVILLPFVAIVWLFWGKELLFVVFSDSKNKRCDKELSIK